MNRIDSRCVSRLRLMTGIFLGLCGTATGGGAVSLDEAWVVPFAGEPTGIKATIQLEPGHAAALGWELSVSRAVVARGELALGPSTERTRAIRIPFDMPSIRPDVRLPAEFRAYLIGTNRESMGESRRRFPILGDNPFPAHAAQLRALRIYLFDPGGGTAETLENAGVPFTRIHSLSALAGEPPGLLLVGEDLSPRETPALPELLRYALRHRIPVLCLSTRDGALPLPLARAEGNGIDAIRLAHHRGLPPAGKDSLAGPGAWGAAGPNISGSMRLSHSRDGIAGNVTTDTRGWPWVEVEYTGRPGRWIWCGIGIMAAWDQTPAARWLLLEWIEYAAGRQNETE